MNQKKVLVLFLAGAILTMISFQTTYSLFSSSANNNNNTFTSAAQFPSTSPSISPTITPSVTVTPTITPTPTATPSPQLGDVVINEINWGGSGQGSSDEWVELRNTTSNAISLFGWVIENLGASGGNVVITNPTANIPANGFFLLSNLSKATSRINVDPDMVTSSISLLDGGEQLRLKTSSVSGTLIDTANPSSGAWLAGDDNFPDKSMERKTPPGDGTLGTNWQTATTHTGMDGTTATDEFGTPNNVNGL